MVKMVSTQQGPCHKNSVAACMGTRKGTSLFISVSHDIEKVTILGIKQVYMLYGEDGEYTARFLS